MGKKRIAAIKDMGDSVDLMGSKCDFWADTSESDMASVILTGSHRVKSVVVITDKAVSPFWGFPYPILKRLLDDFLLRLCRRGFLCIEHRFFIAVFVIHIIKDTGVTQI